MQKLMLYNGFKRLLSAAAILTLVACAFPGVHKLNIQQGNIVTQEMLDKLEPGMSRSDVHFVLGNPVINNVTRSDVEQYLYTYQIGDGEREQQTVTIFYENERYQRHEAKLVEEHKAY